MNAKRLAVWMLILLGMGAGVAGAQETPDPIAVLKAGGSPDMSLLEARKVLVGAGGNTVKRLADTLSEPGVNLLTRLNVAVVLAEKARTQSGEDLKKGLVQCTRDSSPGVRYWGLVGLARLKGFSPAEMAKVLDQYLPWRQPRVLRLQAVEVARQRKLKTAVPWLIHMLRKMQPAYLEARQKAAVEFFAGPRTGPVVEERELPPPVDLPPAFEEGFESPEEMMEGLGREGARRPPTRRSPPGVRPPTSPGVPSTRRPREAARMDVAAQVARMKASRAGQAQIRELAKVLEDLEAVADIRRIGAALQAIVSDVSPESAKDPALNFRTAQPWELEKAIAFWSGWFEKNRARYPGGPPPEKKPDTEE